MDDSLTVSTIIVCAWSILLICIPFALHGGDGVEGSSVLFVSIPPAMNHTMSNAALLRGIKPDVTLFELENRFWAHCICIAAALEALLLWAKVSNMSDVKDFTYSNVIRIGGLYTANTEFWFFVGLHHTVFIMLLLSPMSLHSLLLFVWVGVGTLSAMCAPSDDHDEDSTHGEVYCNRVTSTFFLVLVLCILFALDARMNRSNIGYIPEVQTNLLVTQFFIDVFLTIVHVSIHVDTATCYYARLVYTFTCGVLVVCFLAWA